jgi:hypothetical protein
MRRPSPATLIALAALFVALGGPAQAARLIDGKDIKKGAVASKQVKDGAIERRDLSKRAVRTLRATPDGSITAAKLGQSSVTTRALAPGSVLTGSVGDDSLTAADLAPTSVAGEEVADNAIGQTEIRNNGVGATEIADQSIDGGEIIDGGLRARDIARFGGTLTVDFSPLGPGQCQAALVSGTPADLANADISNDMIVLSPAFADPVPVPLTFGTARTTALDQFRVYACSAAGVKFNPPVLTFRYLIVGF